MAARAPSVCGEAQADDRRRRRKHESRALRDAQAEIRLRPRACNAVYDTTIGWRFVNRLMKVQYGVDSMPETAENVAEQFKHRSARGPGPHGAGVADQGGGGAEEQGFFDAEIDAREHRAEEGRPGGREPSDEHPRETSHGGTGKLPEGRGPARRHGDRRQCQRRQRRRLRACCWPARRRGSAPRAEAARPRGRHGHRRRGAAHHGHRPGAGVAQGAGSSPG